MTETRVISLPTLLDYSATTQLAAEFKAALHTNVTVLIDAASVSRASTVALQLLLSFARQRHADGRDFIILKPATTLINAIQMLGMTDDFKTVLRESFE